MRVRIVAVFLSVFLCGGAAFGAGNVVISQVYPGGGLSGATYTHDFVELRNRSEVAVSLNGWSLQYGVAPPAAPTTFGSSAAFNVALPNVTLQPGQYFLIQLASSGGGGVALPAPDVTGTFALPNYSKLALVTGTSALGCGTAALPCGPAQFARIIDLVGVDSAEVFEGSGATPAVGSNAQSLYRAADGCTDTDDNAADFTSAIAVARNTASTYAVCSPASSTDPVALGGAQPALVSAGAQVLLEAGVRPGTNPASTGLAVSVDATAIGAGATQALLDDGTGGDLTAGDGVYSALVTVAAATTAGPKSLTATVTDGQAREATAAITLTVARTAGLVVSQLYPQGGALGATYSHDFIELFNASAEPRGLASLSLQFATASNFAANPSTNLPDVTLQPGQYYLVQWGPASANGVALPAPDLTDAAPALPNVNGTLALVVGTTRLACNSAATCSAVQESAIIDLVGFGATSPFYEGAGPAPTPTATTALWRAANGCTDTDDNAADFAAAAPAPRNTATTLSPCPTGSTPPSGVGLATPASVVQGGTTLLTVDVTPGTSPASTGLAVSADLTSIGGGATQAFFDDGTNGDASAGDNVFSYQATVDVAAAVGVKSLAFTITDAQSRSGAGSIALTVTGASTPPSGVGVATPASVAAGDATLLTVTVTPGTNPASTGLGVTADLTSIGGGATQAFFDDGTNGDASAGDNVFSYQVTVDAAVAVGDKTLPFTIADAQSRSGAGSIALTVTGASTPPSGTGLATPATVGQGATTLLTVEVVAGTNPDSTGLTVTANLTAIGGAASQALFDDGTNGDATSGDGIFSYQATVAGDATVGDLTLPFTVADAQSRTGNGVISLTVTPPPTPPTGIGAATPATVQAGSTTLLTVAVTPGTYPDSTGLIVTVNLAAIGGGASQTLFDDGTNGDVTAGDDVFSYLATVPAMTLVGVKTLPFAIADAEARTGGGSITITVAAIGDSDGDGVQDSVENASPGGGDGNADGIPDSQQADVASLLSTTSTWLTIETSGGCSQLTGVYVAQEGVGMPLDNAFDHPFGLIGFTAPCSSATITVRYHGATQVPPTYRKYGPLTPGGSTSGWYTLPGVGFSTDGLGVPTATFTLSDGALGDDTGVDGQIVDQGGPGQGAAGEAIPALGGVGLAMLIAMLGLVGVLVVRRLG